MYTTLLIMWSRIFFLYCDPFSKRCHAYHLFPFFKPIIRVKVVEYLDCRCFKIPLLLPTFLMDHYNSLNVKQDWNGSLFTYLLAIVMENSKENKMSSELPISRLKMGDRKQGNPRDPKGVERGYPCLRSPNFWPRNWQFTRILVFLTVFQNVASK